MESSNRKKIFLAASAVVSITLLATVIFQGGFIVELKKAVQVKDVLLVKANQQLDEQRALTDELQFKLEVYQDSIDVLNLENQALHGKIERLKETIFKLNKSLGKQEEKVRQLTKEIKQLLENGKVNNQAVAKLEKERDELLREMEANDRERITLINWKNEAEAKARDNHSAIGKVTDDAQEILNKIDPAPFNPPAPIINQSPVEIAEGKAEETTVSNELQATIINRQQERLKKIISSTSVKYHSISLKNREEGNDLKKLKDKEEGWRYTFIDLDLDNLDKSAIIDETFLVQIFDLDNQLVVPFNEKNLAYPNSEMGAKGYKFKYDGNQVSIRYINTQPKEGRNYEIRLLYYKNGLTFMVDNGSKRIVDDGKVTVD